MGCGSVKQNSLTTEPIQMKQKCLKLKTSSTLTEDIKKKVFRNKDGQLFYVVEQNNKFVSVPVLDSLDKNNLLNRRRQQRTQSEQII